MRTPMILLSLALIFAFLGACNNDKGRGLNQYGAYGYSPTPDCLLSPRGSGGLCYFEYSQSAGFYNYNFNGIQNGLSNNYASGFCGCSNGTFPVYQNNWGLGCIEMNSLQQLRNYNSNLTFLMYTWSAQNLQWVPASTNYLQTTYGQCLNTVIMSCDASAQGSCGPSATCQSLTGNSGGYYNSSVAGVCVTNNYAY